MSCANCGERIAFQVRLASGTSANGESTAMVVPVCFSCMRRLEEFDSVRQLPFVQAFGGAAGDGLGGVVETRARFIPPGHELYFWERS